VMGRSGVLNAHLARHRRKASPLCVPMPTRQLISTFAGTDPFPPAAAIRQ
jgi:hypothetical protein